MFVNRDAFYMSITFKKESIVKWTYINIQHSDYYCIQGL